MIAIVDYKAGNLTSVRLAFDALGIPARVTSEPREVLDAERVVFPGVGAAGAAVRTLGQLGLSGALKEAAARGTPFLGICLGTQILFDDSEEDGGVPCLGLVPGRARLFRPADRMVKVPHMGWNAVRLVRSHPVFDGIESDSEFYFVHSYYPAPAEERDVVGRTDYAGVSFASVVGRGNLIATQFHPEKSGRVGLRLLKNFAAWSGTC